jgi:xylulose-5-phosphate/fructose-6-phosphate phosphoketolase
MFINNLLNVKSQVARIYFPADSNCFISTLDHCLSSSNKINLIVATKNPMPVLLPIEEAVKHCVAGASIWSFCSTDNGINPDVVLVGIGNETNFEVVEACRLLAKYCPGLRVRMVNVNDLMMLDLEMKHPHSLNEETFSSLFTRDRPVIWNFHGYPSVLRSLLFGRHNTTRFKINGYIEEGTTTTPFKMLTSNQVSRFHVAIQAIQSVMGRKEEVGFAAHSLISNIQHALREHDRYIQKFGKDPENINRWVEPLLVGAQQRIEPRL